MARETKVSNNPPKTLSINNNFQVQTELDKLQTNLEVMDKEIYRLEERLSPVLKTCPPTVAINEEKPELVELAGNLLSKYTTM